MIDLLKLKNDAIVIWSQVDAVDPCTYVFIAVGERACFGVQAGKLGVSRSLGGRDEREETRKKQQIAFY